MTIQLKVNGKPVTVKSPADTPLLWVLRDELNLTGTKFGCGKAQCGACTVHVNGQAQRSCILPVSAAADAEVVTIEGLSEDGNHPVQQAWRELNVPQCGYCQVGQMMQAASFLQTTDNPDAAQVDRAMSGNLCRCGTYPRIRQAVLRAAEVAKS
ncbi:MAG: (2Fe-2S)-binding protein [Wenzhouxiangellaceae bacterium]